MNNDNKEFSIKETVNKNVERVQFPQFNQHNSLLGWCSMNYPRVLQNPMYMPKPKPKVYDDNLDFLYQKRAKDKQNCQLIKPFTNFSIGKDAIPMEGVGVPPPGFKKSLKQLTTTKPESRALMRIPIKNMINTQILNHQVVKQLSRLIKILLEIFDKQEKYITFHHMNQRIFDIIKNYLIQQQQNKTYRPFQIVTQNI